MKYGLKEVLAVSAISFLLTGCGYIRNTYVSDETLINKAAFALGQESKNIILVDKKAELSEIRYTVKIKGQKKTKQCYFSTALAVDSDAVCSGTANPLTKSK